MTLVERWNPSTLNSVFRTQIHQFWKQLFEDLKIIVDVLREIDFTGSLSTFGDEIVRVSLSDATLVDVFTRADLILDGERIRCTVLNGGIFYLDFVTTSGNEIVVQDIQQNGDPMDAWKTAEYVIDRMVNIIEWIRS